MRSIPDTIARLSAIKARRTPGRSTASDRLSELTDFGANPGALKAWTYVPAGLKPGAPLVVVLHGCTQTAGSYDHGSGWSTLADREGFALLFPEQQRANNANLCFNWFEPADTRRGGGEAFSIRNMTEALSSKLETDRKRIFVTGLSAGGAMTSVMLATYPELFAGGAVIAGLPYGCASSIPEAFDRMRGHGGPDARALQAAIAKASPNTGPWPTISVWHGVDDRTVAPSNADSIVKQWAGVLGATARPTRFELGDGCRRDVWCDQGGNEVIERYVIQGLGHGTPLDSAADGIGNPAPYMIDVGISSTLRIARRWGLTAHAESTKRPNDRRASETPALDGEIILPQSAKSPREAAPDAGIRNVIEDALRAAGLMR